MKLHLPKSLRPICAFLALTALCLQGAFAAAPIFRIKAKLDKGQVLIDGGASMGLEAGDVLFIHDDAQNLGRVTVSRVTDTEGYATITDEVRAGAIEVGNLVEFEPIREKMVDTTLKPVGPGVPLSSPVREAETLVMGARYSPTKLQEMDDRIRSLKQQLNLGGKDVRLFVELGEAYLMKNELDAAINWLKQGVQLDDKSDYVPRGLYRIAQAYLLSGRNDRAVRYLNFLTANYPASAYNKTLNQAAREAREMFETYSLDQALLEPETRLQRSGPTMFSTSGMTRKPVAAADDIEEKKTDEPVKVEQECPAKVNSLAGTVESQLDGASEYKAVKLDDCLYGGDSLKTGEKSGVVLRIKGGDVIALYEKSMVKLEGVRRKEDSTREITGISAEEAQIWADLATDAGAFKVTTPTGVVNVRGTKFLTRLLKTASGALELAAYTTQGKVELADSSGATAAIEAGQWVSTPGGKVGAVTEFDVAAFNTWLDTWYGKLAPGVTLEAIEAASFTGFPKAAGGGEKKGMTVPANQTDYLRLLDLATRPTLNGIGGLDSTPTGVVRPSFQVKVDRSTGEHDDKALGLSADAEYTTIAASYGGNGNYEIGAYKRSGEIDVNAAGGLGDSDAEETGFGVKLLSKPKAGAGGPRYGVAVTYASTELEIAGVDNTGAPIRISTDDNTTRFWAFGRWGKRKSLFHLGMFYEDADNNNNNDDSDIGFFLSYAQLMGQKGLGYFEFITHDEDDSLNLGYRYGISDVFTLDAVARDVLDSEDKEYGLGLTYSFGGPKARATLAEVEGLK